VTCESIINIVPICIVMETWLVKVKVGGCGMQWIKTIFFLMKPTSCPTFFLLCFNPPNMMWNHLILLECDLIGGGGMVIELMVLKNS
jgi:hypothetical protein